METKNLIRTWRLRITLIVVLGSVFLPLAHSVNTLPVSESESESIVEVELNGDWEKTRSFFIKKTFAVFTNGHTLFVENDNPNCNLSIQIVDYTGQTVIEEIVPQAESSYIVIPIDTLPDGIYTLEIRNAFGGYLYGEFTIEN